MNEQKKVHITIFQAPFASLIDLGLYMKMHDPKQPFQATVPAEYYLAVLTARSSVRNLCHRTRGGGHMRFWSRCFPSSIMSCPPGTAAAACRWAISSNWKVCTIYVWSAVLYRSHLRPAGAVQLLKRRRHARCPCLMERSCGQPPTRNLRIRVSISTLLLLMAQKTACVSWSTAWRRSLAMNCASVSIAQRVMRLSTITATI